VRKRALFSVLLSMMVLITGGCVSQTGTQPKGEVPPSKEIRMGIVPLPQYAHMWIAKKKGFIDEELQKVGFHLKWQPFNMGPIVSEAFAAGQLDMGVMGDFPSFVGKAAGVDYRIVGIAAAIPKSQALVVPINSNLVSVTDLKGKKVSTSKGSSGQKLLTSLLEENGMTINDIQFINMSMEDLATALVRGSVDAGVMWEPVITRLEDAGEIKIIADGSQICPAYSVVVASENILAKNPAAMDAMRKAYHRGNEYLKQNPDECVELLMEEMKMSKQQLLKIIKKFDHDGPINDKFIADMQDTEIFLRKNGVLKTQVDIATFILKE
jgi:sulfonate transport system substrate-binding protein